MGQKLFTGGIYNYGADPEDTILTVVVRQTRNNILLVNIEDVKFLIKKNRYDNLNHSDVLKIMDNLNDFYYSTIDFFTINRNQIKTHIHGYLGTIPAKAQIRLYSETKKRKLELE